MSLGEGFSVHNMPGADYRHLARSLALQVLYELDSTGHRAADVLTTRLEAEGVRLETRQLVTRLVYGVLEHREALNALIRRYTPERSLDLLAVVDRNILRMAVYELAFERETPVKVAINEAVELAKLFGAETTARFINGVLGSLAVHEPDLQGVLTGATAHDNHHESQT